MTEIIHNQQQNNSKVRLVPKESEPNWVDFMQ